MSYARFLKAGGFSPAARLALDHAYALSFFDRPSAVWRLGYAFENWSSLPPSLRADVLGEGRVAASDYDLQSALRARLKRVQNPAGRKAGAAVLAGPWSVDHHPLD